MRKVYKRMYIAVLVILALVIALDFIPVKVAKVIDYGYYRYNNGVKISNFNDTDILATYSKKTGDFNYPWEAHFEYSSEITDVVIFKVTGSNPYQTLSRKDFYHNGNWVIGIDFMLKGNMQMIGEGSNVAEFNVSDWDIVYPIRRAGFRRYYAPTSYLTIYDFEWFKR